MINYCYHNCKKRKVIYLASFDLKDTLGVFMTLIMENKSQVVEACGFVKQFVNYVVKKFSTEVYVGGRHLRGKLCPLDMAWGLYLSYSPFPFPFKYLTQRLAASYFSTLR